jgi:transposase
MQTIPDKNYSHFKELNQLCLPMDVGVLIPNDDSVRLLFWLLRQLNLSALHEAYAAYREMRRKAEAVREREAAGRGTEALWEAEEAEAAGNDAGAKKRAGRPPCDLLVLLSVTLYGYMEHVYSSRGIARACRQNINFMWLLNGNAPPSHGMINGFRKHLLGRAMERLCGELALFMEKCGEVRFEHVFIDGTMIEARANRHTAVWRKNLDRYENGQREKIAGIMQAINQSGGTQFAENEGPLLETAEKLRACINEKLENGCGEEAADAATADGAPSRGTLKEWRQILKESVKKLHKYQKQREIMGERNSYSKTDTDAVFMRMKDETLKAAYNVQIAVEGEYILGAGIFANPNDGTNLKAFLRRLQETLGKAVPKITADAGYESEENYAYLEEHQQEAYIKPKNYERMKTGAFRKDISKRENMAYDALLDEYTCANNRKLRVAGTETQTSKSGYESEVTMYECESCEGCAFRERCTASKTNRRLGVSKKLLACRAQSLERITSAEGTLLRVNRSIQVEGAFGVTKEDRHFRRFLTRGKTGASCELFLLCFGYNVNKLHCKIQQGRCGKSLHPLKQAS